MIKKLTLIGMCLISLQLMAQKPEVSDIEAAMSLGTRPAYTTKVKDVSEKKAIQVWEDFVKDEFGSKPKSVKGSNELMAEGAKNKSISKEEFTIYSSTIVSGNDVLMTVWFDLGSGFLNKSNNSSAHETAKAKLADFNYAVQRDLAVEAVEKEEDKLKNAEKSLSRIIDDGESIKKDIRNYEDKIEKAKRELEQNIKDQEAAKATLDAQTKSLNDSRLFRDKIGK
jgi:hypothetical protein